MVDTDRLVITDLGLFNADSPVQTYDLRTNAEFETVETKNATFFVVTFYPARILRDSNFYRHGPHGVNVTFLFTAARHQQAGDTGVVTYSGVAIKAPAASEQQGAASSTSSSSASTTIVAIASGAALVALVAIAAVVVILRKRSTVATGAAEV